MYKHTTAIENNILRNLADGKFNLKNCRNMDGQVVYSKLTDMLISDQDLRHACTFVADGDELKAGIRLVDAIPDGWLVDLAEGWRDGQTEGIVTAAQMETAMQEHLYSQAVKEVTDRIEKEFGGNFALDAEVLDSLTEDEGTPDLDGFPVFDIRSQLEEEVRDAAECGIRAGRFSDCKDAEELEERLYEIASDDWDIDNGYSYSHFASAEMVSNFGLLLEAIQNTGYAFRSAAVEAEAMLSTIRFYLLPEVVAQVVNSRFSSQTA